jgi:hypothetical protein
MKKMVVSILAVMMALALVSCGNRPEVIENFEDLDTSKFHGCISGDGYFLVLYEGVIDEAVMGAVLMTESGESVTLSEETIVKNPDGNSLLFFEQVSVEMGDTVSLALEKEGYEKLVFDVTVEY